MTTAIVCSAILAASIFVLGFNVSLNRGYAAKRGSSQMPTDPADPLLIAQRAHGNAAEYVPTLIALFLLVGWQSPQPWAPGPHRRCRPPRDSCTPSRCSGARPSPPSRRRG